MRIAGIDPAELPNEYVLVLPRGETRVVFRAVAVPDWDTFDTLCPEPKPPMVTGKNGSVANVQDDGYRQQLASYGELRLAWLVVQSLIPSQIEWATVKPDEPRTWRNWRTDLQNAKFSNVEIGRVLLLVTEANCLDERKLEEARKAFLHGQQAESATSSGPLAGPQSSPSGAPVNASA